jgi:hypothetical protein
LHAVWDKYIPHKIVGLSNSAGNPEEKIAAADWADKLYADNKDNLKNQCADMENPLKCIMKWAAETNKYICSFVLNVGELTDMEEIVAWFDGRDLSTDYYEGAAPIAENLIGLAGIRLGAYLNALVAAAQAANVRGTQEPLGDFDL